MPHERRCAQRRGGLQEQGRKIGFVFGVSIHFSILLLLFHLRCQLKPRMEKCKFNNAHFFLYLCFWWHDANRPISVNLETACKSLFEVSASEYVCVCVYNGCMASVFFGEYEYECANIWRWRLVVAARFVVGDWLLAKSFWLTAKFTLMRLAGVRCILSAIFGVLYFNFFIFIFFGCFAAMKFSDCGSNGVVDVWFLKSPSISDVWVVYT